MGGGNKMINKNRHKLFSSSEESRIKKMKRKLLLDDVGTATGIHPLYRKVKEKVTGKKTLYHYTKKDNVDSILKNGLDPRYDRHKDMFEDENGNTIDPGIYYGNQSKSIPRSTAISRYKEYDKALKKGKDIQKSPRKYDKDLGEMLEIKLPISKYKKMRKLEEDPLADEIKGWRDFYKLNRGFKEDYDKASSLEKLKMRWRANNDSKHLKKDVVLLQEKVDPKYITKIDKNWS